MSHASTSDALTNDERIALLTAAGLSVADAEQAVLRGNVVIDEADDDVLDEIDEPEPVVIEPVVPTAKPKSKPAAKQVSDDSIDIDATVAGFVKQASNDQDRALTLCVEFSTRWFDARKMSKVQAAAAGLDLAGKTLHNKTVHAASQSIQTSLKAGVRAHYRVNSVKARIAASTKSKSLPAVTEEGLDVLMSDPRFLALAREVLGSK